MTEQASPSESHENTKKISHTLINENNAEKGIFIGRIQKYDIKTSKQNGSQYLRFAGDFEAEIEGKKFRSHVLYVPGLVEMELGSAFNNAITEAGEKFGGLDFAVEIYKVPSENSITKYEWRFKHLLKPSEQGDPIAQIRTRIQLPQLASPVSEPTPEKGKRK